MAKVNKDKGRRTKDENKDEGLRTKGWKRMKQFVVWFHSAFRTPNSAFGIPHSAIRIRISAIRTLHSNAVDLVWCVRDFLGRFIEGYLI